MTDEVGSLEAAALKRKERLAALREAKIKKNKEGDKKTPLPSFRSYKPADESLKDLALPEPEIEEITDKVKDDLDNEDKGVVMESLDFTNLAPKKPDWDLKRDIAPKLERLEKRTQKAIAELIRERLKKEDLANAVIAGASAALNEGDED
jgi:coiled-coil domain-containing protein 12